MSEIRSTSADSLLDIGTGDGTRLARIIENFSGITTVAIEESPSMYSIAQQNLKNVRLINSEFVASGLPQNSFSHITALWNVLGHVENRQLFLKSVYQSLKTNGLFLLDVNNRYNIKEYGIRSAFNNLRNNFCSPAIANRYKLRCSDVEAEVFIYSKQELIRELKEAGFLIMKMLYVNYNNGHTEKFPIFGQLFCVARRPL